MPASWQRELWMLAGIIVGSLLLGALTRYPFSALALGFGLYISIHLHQLYQLHRWLSTKRTADVPEGSGVWGEVFTEIRKWKRETERHKDRLTGMLERFQDASAAVPDAMVILSQDDEIEWANRAAGRLLGIHWPRDARLRVFNLVRNPQFSAYLEGGDYSGALQLPSPAVPEYTVSLQIVPFGSSQKLLIARDVSQLVKLEQMRQNFVANVSHELRTPVTVLSGFLETLKDMRDIPAHELHKHLTTMHSQALRMQRLVDDLLALSKLETAPPHAKEEVVDVPAMLRELQGVGEILSGEARHVIALEADSTLHLLGNREELRSAFSNLINNAVRYTPAAGRIGLTWTQDAEGVKFSVQDSGPGIAPQHIPHLTERFYRVDTARSRETGGTGLGLSIVKHVLLRHEGKLLIESELGHGSTFTCLFPATRAVRKSGLNIVA